MFGGEQRRRRRGGAGRRRPGDVPGQGGGPQPDRALRGSRASPQRRRGARRPAARIRDALTARPAQPHTQPIRSLASGGIERYELLLRMTDDDGELLPAASFIEVGGALRHDPGARPLGRRPGARAARRARARGRPGLPARQPLRRLAHRPLGARVHRAPARRRRRRPGPLHLRDHRDGAGPRLRRGAPASPTASPSSAARSRSTTTAPASAPSTT